MSIFYIKMNDTSPPISGVMERPLGTPLSLVGATARFHMRRRGAATPVIDAAATIVDAAAGLVKYDWQAGDTDTEGFYEVEFEITFSSGAVETFPNNGFTTIHVFEEIT